MHQIGPAAPHSLRGGARTMRSGTNGCNSLMGRRCAADATNTQQSVWCLSTPHLSPLHRRHCPSSTREASLLTILSGSRARNSPPHLALHSCRYQIAHFGAAPPMPRYLSHLLALFYLLYLVSLASASFTFLRYGTQYVLEDPLPTSLDGYIARAVRSQHSTRCTKFRYVSDYVLQPRPHSS